MGPCKEKRTFESAKGYKYLVLATRGQTYYVN